MKFLHKARLVAVCAAVVPVAAMMTPPRPAMAAAAEISDIRWQVSRKASGAGQPTLRLTARQSNSDVALDGRRDDLAAARRALGGGAGPVTFHVVHDAGRLDCRGALTASFAGGGQCRFTPDAAFARAMQGRGIGTPTARQQLAMLMVDARLALADGLIREGLRPRDNDDLIAAAALDVTPAYVRELRSGALKLGSVHDAIACKALGIDGAYVRGMAAAGYTNLSSDQLVSMKALGVTPAYARSMNAAAKGDAK